MRLSHIVELFPRLVLEQPELFLHELSTPIRLHYGITHLFYFRLSLFQLASILLFEFPHDFHPHELVVELRPQLLYSHTLCTSSILHLNLSRFDLYPKIIKICFVL